MIEELPGIADKLSIKIDLQKLTTSIDNLKKLLFSEESNFTFNKWYSRLETKTPSINLNQISGADDETSWFKNNGSYNQLKTDGVFERDFVEINKSIVGTYIDNVISLIKNDHKKTFGSQLIGRCQLLYIKPEYCYKIHTDLHIAYRYHIPIETSKNSVWLFRTNEIKETLLHMPADGHIWRLNPCNNEHTVINYGDKPRLHLIITGI